MSRQYSHAQYDRALVSATLYVMPGSLSSTVAKLIVEHKGIAYREVELVNPVRRTIVQALGFPGFKTPSLSTDGRRLHGTLAIAEGLEEIQHDPPLFPDDPQRREQVVEAERWAEETLEALPRRIAVLRERPPPQGATEEEGNVLARVAGEIVSLGAPPLLWLHDRVVGSHAEAVARALAELSQAMDHIDGLIEAGVLGGAVPNAADFQIAARVRELLQVDSIREHVEGRPAARHAASICPKIG
jgi:glutathione S-transferase